MSKESEKYNENIKEVEKWVYHSLDHPKANRFGFVVASRILIPFKPVNRFIFFISLFIFFISFIFLFQYVMPRSYLGYKRS